jgi:hypothetical protein
MHLYPVFRKCENLEFLISDKFQVLSSVPFSSSTFVALDAIQLLDTTIRYFKQLRNSEYLEIKCRG